MTKRKILIPLYVCLSNVLCQTTEQACRKTVYSDHIYGNFEFPETSVGGVAEVPCPFGAVEQRQTKIYPSVVGLEGNLPEDLNEEVITGAFRSCVASVKDNESVAAWDPRTEIFNCRNKGVTRLEADLMDLVEQLTPFKFKQALPLLSSLKLYAAEDFVSSNVLIDGVSEMLDAHDLFQSGAVSEMNAKALFNIIYDFSEDISLDLGYKVKVGNKKVSVETAQFPTQKETTSYPVLSKLLSIDYETSIDGDTLIKVPKEALALASNSQRKDTRLRVTTYSPNLFFHWREENNTVYGADFLSGDVNMNASMIDDKWLGSWRVLEIEFQGTEVSNLTRPIEFTIKHGAGPNYRGKCVYWDSNSKRWVEDGIETLQIENGVRCFSTHLSAFSAIIDPLPLSLSGEENKQRSSVQEHILKVLSSIGSAFSIFGLAGTVLTYSLFRSLRKERSNRILLNLSISLMLLHLISVTGSKDLWHGHCLTPAALMHYFTLTSVAWMSVEAFNMHQLLISVFTKHETRFMMKRLLLAWGFPFFLVTTCLLVVPKAYRVGRDDLCLIAAHENISMYYAAYIIPIAAMLILNFSIFCRIFTVLYKQTNRIMKQNERGVGGKDSERGESDKKFNKLKRLASRYKIASTPKLSSQQIKGTVSVMILIGVGWVFGLLAIGPFQIFFRYVFTLCNAGQGILIFIFRVCLHPQATREWKKVIIGLTLDSEFSSSFSSRRSGSSSLSPPSVISFSASTDVPVNVLEPSVPKTLSD